MEAHVWNSNTWEAEARVYHEFEASLATWWVQGQPEIQNENLSHPLLQIKTKQNKPPSPPQKKGKRKERENTNNTFNLKTQ